MQDQIKEWTRLPRGTINTITDIDHRLTNLGDTGKRLLDSLKTIYSFKEGNNKKVLLTGLVVIAICTGISYLITNGNPAIFGKLATILSVIAAGTQQLVQFVLPYKKQIDTMHDHLVQIKKSAENLKEEKLKEENEKQEKIKKEIKDKEEEKKKNQETIAALTLQKAEIEKELFDIKTGKKLAAFIESRVIDQRYMNSLGIVSWIRKDFETLDGLLRDQKKTNSQETDAQKQLKAVMQIDRIVLYIDDLDRCNEDIVVRVLESIHLLLAFELFVVVVGVDPRWMYNALKSKYKKLLKAGQSEKTTENKPTSNSRAGDASPYDYLEKIFQVPFVLKPIDKDGRDDMLTSQFRDEHSNENAGAANIDHKKQSGDQPGTKDIGKTDEEKKREELQKQNERERIKKQMDEQAALETHATEKLAISKDEINFMKAISELIGDTPRTIKRFANIYRIIRTHPKLEIQGEPMETYCAVMILLGIITGLPNESTKLFVLLKGAPADKKTLGELINDQSSVPKDLKNCLLIKFKLNDTTEKVAADISLNRLRANMELVMRFSFRSYELHPADN